MLTLPSPGSGPDLDKTIHSRKTPRMPPPRASTPKHTNIGSPRRSTGRPISQRASVGLEEDDSPARTRTQPPANRRLDFGDDGVRRSIESPFKPRHVLRRSMGAQQENPFANGSPVRTIKPSHTMLEEDEVDADADDAKPALPAEDGPLLLDDDDYYSAVPQQSAEPTEEAPAEEQPAKRKPGRPRKSGGSANGSFIQHTPPAANMNSGRKRTRASLDGPAANDDNLSHSMISESGRASKRGRASREQVIVHQDEGEVAVDPSLIAHGDEYVVDVPEESIELVEPVEPAEPAEQSRKTKGKGKKAKGKAPKGKDANRANGTKVRINDSPSKLRYNRESRESSRGLSVGPVSNVHLRASTPFEDANQRTSRYGRALLNPLKYWANEMRIYKNGETAGIVRADEVEPPKRKRPKKKGKKKQLDGIDEESDTVSTHPDEWEEELGVISGMVANWDPETQAGLCDPEDLVREGMCASSSPLHHLFNTNSMFHRSRICTRQHRYSRCSWLRVQIRKNHDPPLLRLRHRRAATRRLQAREKQQQNADVLFRARRQGHGGGWWSISRDEPVRHLQRWCVGRASR